MINIMNMDPAKGVIYYLEPEQNSFYVSGAEIEKICIHTLFGNPTTIAITFELNSWPRCTSKHYLIYSGLVDGVYTSFPLIHDGYSDTRECVRTFRIIGDAYPDYILRTMTKVTKKLFVDETAYIDRNNPVIVFGDVCYPIIFKESFGCSNCILIKKEVVNEAVEPKYTVCANLCDGEDYIKHWHGGTFTDIKAAYKFYKIWKPNKKEVRQAILDDLKNSHFDEYNVDNLNQYDLQICCRDEDGAVVECEGVDMFSSTTIDVIN